MHRISYVCSKKWRQIFTEQTYAPYAPTWRQGTGEGMLKSFRLDYVHINIRVLKNWNAWPSVNDCRYMLVTVIINIQTLLIYPSRKMFLAVITCDYNPWSNFYFCWWLQTNSIFVLLWLYLNLTGNPPYRGTKGNLVHSYSLRNHSATKTCFTLLLTCMKNMNEQMNRWKVDITAVLRHILAWCKWNFKSFVVNLCTQHSVHLIK